MKHSGLPKIMTTLDLYSTLCFEKAPQTEAFWLWSIETVFPQNSSSLTMPGKSSEVKIFRLHLKSTESEILKVRLANLDINKPSRGFRCMQKFGKCRIRENKAKIKFSLTSQITVIRCVSVSSSKPNVFNYPLSRHPHSCAAVCISSEPYSYPALQDKSTSTVP